VQAQREIVGFLSAYQEIWHRFFPDLHRRGQWHLVSHLCVRARAGAPVGELSGMVKQVFLLDDATVRERLGELYRLGFSTIEPADRPVSARTLVLPTPLLTAKFDGHLIETAGRLLETALAMVFGVLLIIRIGGADMPTVIALLNSYSGLSSCAMGFALDNKLLIIAGALDGSSGLILSIIMCRAMNRSFTNVLFGGFGQLQASAAGQEARPVRSASPEEAAAILGDARTVVVIPGYGMAVAQAQHKIRELHDILTKRGVEVRFAIHPVAGRMPGHMNVLLAEADVPYDKLVEMEDINSDMAMTDVALIVGANDIVNPAAQNDPGSPIAGMPILDAYKSRTVMIIKRGMSAGFAGIDNELYYMDKTLMLFGDAKSFVASLVKEIGANHD